jgi:uncharacterized RDD family membrane protein YckC
MEWYYVDAGQQAGPITETQLSELVAAGKVRADTLVWRQGLAEWVPHGNARTANPALAATLAEKQVVCSECKQIVAHDQALQYGATWVCAACKPIFVQKLKEGTVEFSSTGIEFGGFWMRFLAKMLDGIIQTICLLIPMVLLMVFVMNAIAQNNSQSTFIMIQVIYQVVALAVGITYNTVFLGKWGATPGKMVCGLKVVKAGGTPISYKRAFGRAWAEYLNMFTLGIGYIIAAFDLEKRSLHDHICNTRVIRTR